jgi:hypothetical protein
MSGACGYVSPRGVCVVKPYVGGTHCDRHGCQVCGIGKPSSEPTCGAARCVARHAANCDPAAPRPWVLERQRNLELDNQLIHALHTIYFGDLGCKASVIPHACEHGARLEPEAAIEAVQQLVREGASLDATDGSGLSPWLIVK